MPFNPALTPLEDTVEITYKPKSVVFEQYCGLGNSGFRMAASPYEVGTAGSYTDVPFEPQDGYYFLDSAYYTKGETYRTSGGGVAENTGPQDGRVFVREDLRLVAASGNGNGFQYTFELKGNKYLFKTFNAGREIKFCIREFVDTAPDEEGFDQRVCINSAWGRAFVKDEGGITVNFGPNGEESATITAVTAEYFLAKTRMPRMGYLLKSVVTAERAKQATMRHTQTDLGFVPLVIDPALGFDKDPFSGAFNFVDEFTATYNDLMVPRPANEVHFLENNSVAYAFKEIMDHHALAGFGTLGGISNYFKIDIVPDDEYRVVSLEHGPGSPHSAALEAIRHGNYRYFWDAQSNMHFFPDYCNAFGGFGGGFGWPDMVASRNFMGQVSVTPGPPAGYPRVERVVIEGQWSGNVANGRPSIVDWQVMPNKAVYPPGTTVGHGGDEVVFQGYHGENVSHIAHAEYNRLSQKTTITVSNFPYACWALNVYQQAINVFIKDPMGAFDYNGGKWFSVESVQIQIDENDIPDCTATMVEIIY